MRLAYHLVSPGPGVVFGDGRLRYGAWIVAGPSLGVRSRANIGVGCGPPGSWRVASIV